MTPRGQKRLRTLPAIRRARGFHLYDNGGRRILDLYLEGGRAWLGHRPEGLSLQLKNTLTRGVYAAYPGSEEGKLLKAARTLAVQSGSNPGCRALYLRGGASDAVIPAAVDPLFSDRGECVLWRPGLPWPAKADYIEILVPLPGFDAGRIIITNREDHPTGDLPSPVIAAALTRCLWTLKNTLETQPASVGIKAGNSWEQKGPYHIFKGSEEEYDTLFKKALSDGILLPPDKSDPMIIPGELTTGDQKLLISFFQSTP